MKRLIYIFILPAILLSSCYEDLGNYEYIDIEEPEVKDIRDSVFVTYIGENLHIKPEIAHSKAGTGNFSFLWEIQVPYDTRTDYYETPELDIIFGLKPGIYNAMLTVTDLSNDMKYFYNFKIEGRTEFTEGTVVLSDEGGVSRLSFIKPDNTILSRLYEGIHGEQLPGKPMQLVATHEAWQPGVLKSYWVVCGEGEKPVAIVDASTMIRSKYINDNFFDAPNTISAGYFYPTMSGVTTGVVNGKLYLGTTSTAPFSPVYGVFGNSAAGDYELHPQYIFTEFQYYIGYDINKKAFVYFNSSAAYFGTEYTVIPTGPGFDPTDVGLDLIYMQYLNGGASYAFMEDENGQVYELKFSNAPDLFFTSYRKEFSGSDLIKEGTKWIASAQEIIYFTSGDKIYRYNPLNEEIKELSANLGGTVSMLKLSASGDVLIAGTEGNLHYLDVGVGKNGEVISTVEGIPGSPVDVIIRE